MKEITDISPDDQMSLLMTVWQTQQRCHLMTDITEESPIDVMYDFKSIKL